MTLLNKSINQEFTSASTLDDILNEGQIASLTIENINKSFVANQNTIEANSLLNVINILARNFENHSFGIEEFLILSAHLDLEFLVLERFWQKYIAKLKEAGKVKEITNGAYNHTVYTFIK